MHSQIGQTCNCRLGKEVVASVTVTWSTEGKVVAAVGCCWLAVAVAAGKKQIKYASKARCSRVPVSSSSGQF